MSELNDNNFGELKKLLKLKQHEVPPPGYFGRFSDSVVSRIQAGETGGPQGWLENFEGSWFLRALQLFQARPGMVGGMATTLCLLLLVGVVMADRPDGASAVSDMTSIQAPSTGGSPMESTVALAPAENSGMVVNTNQLVSLQASPALFGSQQNPLFQPVAFMPSGR